MAEKAKKPRKVKAKKQEGPRMLICAATGVEFEYVGRGRPPLYSPAHKETMARQAAQIAAAKASSKQVAASA